MVQIIGRKNRGMRLNRSLTKVKEPKIGAEQTENEPSSK